MDKVILAAYSGLTITSLMVSILGFSILYRCYKDRDFGSTFFITLAITMNWGAQFISRSWWTVWKDRYISSETTMWMLDHSIVLWCVIFMILSGLLFIKTLTEDSPYGILWKSCASIIFFVMFLVWVTK